jgi:hypothetical protein
MNERGRRALALEVTARIAGCREALTRDDWGKVEVEYLVWFNAGICFGFE